MHCVEAFYKNYIYKIKYDIRIRHHMTCNDELVRMICNMTCRHDSVCMIACFMTWPLRSLTWPQVIGYPRTLNFGTILFLTSPPTRSFFPLCSSSIRGETARGSFCYNSMKTMDLNAHCIKSDTPKFGGLFLIKCSSYDKLTHTSLNFVLFWLVDVKIYPRNLFYMH